MTSAVQAWAEAVRTLGHRSPGWMRARMLQLRAVASGPLPAAPVSPALPASGTRALIAPTNFAGQASAWARALESHANVRVLSQEIGDGALAFPVDLRADPRRVYGEYRWGERQFEWTATHLTHVLNEAARPMFGHAYGMDVLRELGVLRERGLSTAMLAHGSDVRIPSEHVAHEEWSPFREEAKGLRLRELRAHQDLAAFLAFEGPTFVSTPDLLDFLPDAAWCPVIADATRWGPLPLPPTAELLRVVHAPSNAYIKGTPLIEGTMATLERSRAVEFRRLQGIPAAEVPVAYAWADVVLDQFRIGSYGVAACEAMATGRVVVGHVSERVRGRVLTSTGLDLPIVEATPDSLEDVLLNLRDAERRAAIGQAGMAFVAAVHDGRMSANVLRNWLDPIL